MRYVRIGSLIKDTVNETEKQYGTVNKARKASREIQQAKDGGLGLGILVKG